MAMENIKKQKGELRFNVPMSQHTSWRVGGCAKSYYKPFNKEDLSSFLQELPNNEPVVFLGLGSNVLVRDGGINGTVVALQGALNSLRQVNEHTVYAEAGVTCAKLAKAGASFGMAGAEFFAGIPGTVGGALAMNAGAFGGETWSFVEKVATIDSSGQIKERAAEEFKVGYRSVEGLNQEWFIAAQFKFLLAGETESDSRLEIKKLLSRRNETQPTGVYSCGSVFKNPENDFAARLIEAAGMKGARCGGAHVSEKHANFIINDQQAMAEDIETLILNIKEAVLSQFGVELITEVRILGDKK